MEITYDLIKPIILKEDWSGNTVKVQFKASGHDVAKEGTASIVVETAPQSFGGNVAKTAGRSVFYTLFSRTIGSVIRKFIPGFGGSIVSSAAASSAMHYGGKAATAGAQKVKSLTPASKNQAVLEAFNMVKPFFKYDDVTKSWRGVNLTEM